MTRPSTQSTSAALQALTAAALLLPGLGHGAEPGTLDLQISRYEESERDLVTVDSGVPALTADSLHLSGAFLLRDSIRARFDLAQDTWSGATPLAVAPLAAAPNREILRNSPRGLVVSGASPIVNTRVPLDGNVAPAGDPRAVLVMSSASPELRQQGDVAFEVPVERLGPAVATFGAGISNEPDYRSRYVRLGGRFSFNDNLTTLSAGTAFTRSDTNALLDADLLPYLTRNAYTSQLERRGTSELLRGKRRDRAYELGLTQVLDAASVFDAGLTLTRASGFMENPYKAVTVMFTGAGAAPAAGDMRAFLEQRPDARRQLAFHAHYARHFAAADGTLQLDYNRSRDDWNIDTHGVELGWAQALGAWTLTPRLRYYTQTQASFHTAWLLSRQDYRVVASDGSGFTLYSPALLPAHFSSDHRLDAFDAASASLTLQRGFARGLQVEAGIEYYARSGSDYADFDFAMVNLALTADLQAGARRQRREAADEHAAHVAHVQHSTHTLPAGLMFAHGAMPRGEFMSGYRASHTRQHGALLQGTQQVTDDTMAASACLPALRCGLSPASMSMTMHMLDLMYGVSDRATLMLMPQYMTMDMQLRTIPGGFVPAPGSAQGHDHGGGITGTAPGAGAHNHGRGAHTSGAIGDTLAAGIFNLHVSAASALHATLGVSIPTGKTDLEFRRAFQTDGGLMHYEMQTGSGTWDLLPALTWTTARGAWQHGAQLSGVKRLEDSNDRGYRLGDQVQLTGWATRTLAAGFSAAARAVWQHRDAIDGSFNAYTAGTAPMDYPANYGGDYLDIGLGLNLELAGSQLAVEWLAPVHEDVNGFQLERHGTLSASWYYNY